MTARWAEKLRDIFDRLDKESGGRIVLTGRSMNRFIETRAPESAASLAYYALFSLFPLTLFLVVLMSYLLESDAAYRQTLIFIRSMFPFSGDLVERNLTEVLEQRGTIGLVVVLSALWSASGFFNTLARSINRAWPAVKLRGLVHGRLVGLGMIGALLLLLMLSLISSTIISLLPALIRVFGLDPEILNSFWLHSLARLVPLLSTFLMFTALYRWVPNKLVRWKAVLWGAGITTIIWELALSFFTLYLRSGFARFEIVYGSLGTLIVLMIWIYLSNLIALFGAYIVAALDMQAEQAQRQEIYEPKPESSAPKVVRG